MAMDVKVSQAHFMTIIPADEPLYDIRTGKFNGINTWRDWHLLPTSRPVFEPPKVKTNYIDLSGTDGSIDATDMMTGYPAYSTREGSNEFYVITGYGNWANRFSDITDYLHGRKVHVILETDPSYYYEGRLSVNQWQSEKDHSKITIDYILDPWKYDIHNTIDDWLWDPFNFYDGVIMNRMIGERRIFEDIHLKMGAVGTGWLWDPFNFYFGKIYTEEDERASLVIYMPTRTMPSIPVFKVMRVSPTGDTEAPLTFIKYGRDGTTIDATQTITPTDNQYHTYKFPDIILRGAENKLEITCGHESEWYITIEYRAGRL